MKMGDKRNPKYNQSGCADPTAYEAIGRVIKEEAKLTKKARTLITVLKFIINETGFELLNTIEIKDKKTGRRFRYTNEKLNSSSEFRTKPKKSTK